MEAERFSEEFHSHQQSTVHGITLWQGGNGSDIFWQPGHNELTQPSNQCTLASATLIKYPDHHGGIFSAFPNQLFRQLIALA